MNKKQYCEYCKDGEIKYTEYKGTHIFTCDTCPNITFEFYSNNDILALKEFLNNSGNSMSEDQKIKLYIAEYIGIKYLNDVQLLKEIEILLENDEEIFLNISEHFNINYDELINIFNSLGV